MQETQETGSIPGWGRSPAERNGNPLQYCCLKNPMHGGAWWATVQRVATSWTWLSAHTVGSRRERQGSSFSPGASREGHRETGARPPTRRGAGSRACCVYHWVCSGLLPQQREAPCRLCRAACRSFGKRWFPGLRAEFSNADMLPYTVPKSRCH